MPTKKKRKMAEKRIHKVMAIRWMAAEATIAIKSAIKQSSSPDLVAVPNWAIFMLLIAVKEKQNTSDPNT